MNEKAKYYKSIFELLLTEAPPDQMIEDYVSSPFTAPDNLLELTDWCAKHVKLHWMTGTSIIDAADDIYKDAAANSNIR